MTATETIRATIKHHHKDVVALAQELGIDAAELDAFVAGGPLAPQDLGALVPYLWGNAVAYDAGADRLRIAYRFPMGEAMKLT